MVRLKNKVAVITGGGKGIGKGIAEIFVMEGAKIVICGRTKKALDETIKSLRKKGGVAIGIKCDISKSNEVRKMVEKAIEKFGRIDILVNNAGISILLKTFEELTEEEWDRVFNINVKGSWLCSKYIIPEMRRIGGGSIIMISSISAYRGQTLNNCYNASKAAMELLMKNMALDSAKDGIRVNSICPAWIATEKNKLGEIDECTVTLPHGIKKFSDIIKMHPIGRIGKPEDVAWTAVYLASDESSWVTGASFMIDGGYTSK